MSDDPKLVTATVTPAPLPENFSVPGVVALARDLAIGMYDEPILLKKAGITPEQYETLKRSEYFQKIVRELAMEWNSPKTTQERLAIQTAVGLEEVLPDVIARAKIKNEPLQGVAQLVKVLADIAGANSQTRAPAGAGEKFKIIINLGADTQTFDKTKPSVQIEAFAAPEPADSVGDIQPLASGYSSLLSLQTEPEKA